jgi:predicted SAM-dependent methyltransferase
VKLHLGCGLIYLDGYINIDYPAIEHTVQSSLKADIYADIQKLVYPHGTVDEIRLHHVFEHFPRPIALALLCRWRDWLKSGGQLRIETPDVMASFKLMANPFITFDQKQQVMRHIFGSHEAKWAIHCDGWYKSKFKYICEKIGFINISFKTSRWGVLRNLEVVCTKSHKNHSAIDYEKEVSRFLKLSTVRVKTKNKREPEGTEYELLKIWISMWHDAYNSNDHFS